MSYFILTPDSTKHQQQHHPSVFDCKKMTVTSPNCWLLRTENFNIAEKLYRYLKQNYMTYNEVWFNVYYPAFICMTTCEAIEFYLHGKKVGIECVNSEIKTHLIAKFTDEIDFDLVQWH